MRVVAKALDILIFYVYEVKTAALSRFPADNQTSQEDSQGLDASSLEKMEFRAEYFGVSIGVLLREIPLILNLWLIFTATGRIPACSSAGCPPLLCTFCVTSQQHICRKSCTRLGPHGWHNNLV